MITEVGFMQEWTQWAQTNTVSPTLFPFHKEAHSEAPETKFGSSSLAYVKTQ
jgi:hypothetical protein